MDWSQLQDKFYRKQDVYSMQWNTSADEPFGIDQYRIAVCSNGGPIACIRDERQLIVQSRTIKNTLCIYSAAGVCLQEFKLDRSPKLLEFGWSADERLVCIFDNGNVRFFGIDGEFSQVSLGMPNVIDARIWEDGLVALTSTLELLAIDSFGMENKSQVRKFEQTFPDLPHQWIIIPPVLSRGRQVEVVYSLGQSVFITDGFTTADQLIDDGPFSEMVLSNNGKLIALYADEKICVFTIDFKQKLLEFPSKSSIPPNQIAWCGNDSLLVNLDRTLLIIGPFGDWIKYTYEYPIFIHTELDGARIIGDEKTEFLEKVNTATEDALKFGSTSPAALLYDAWDNYEKQDSRADEILRTLNDNLREAVAICIEAAGYEFQPSSQKSLLKAASFGRAFLTEYVPDSYIKMCRDLRVINALKLPEIGIALTIRQYEKLTHDEIIDRLLRRKEHLLALKISEHLKASTERILIHWSCEKMKNTSISDEGLATELIDRLRTVKGTSFSKIATAAFKRGRHVLASMLIDKESRLVDQIPLLLHMQEYNVALEKSISSGDTELVYNVIFHLRRKLTTAEFLKIIASYDESISLLKSFLKYRNSDLLNDYFYQEDLRREHAMYIVQRGNQDVDVDLRIDNYKKALKMIKDDRALIPSAKLVDEMALLTTLQVKFETEYKQPFMNLSLYETMKKLIIIGKEQIALRIKNEFKVSDKRFWRMKIDAYSEGRDFEGLDKFSKSRKSPVGYEPFVNACMKHNNISEAKKYILKCDSNKKGELFMKIGAFREAMDIAFSSKNVQLLQVIKIRCQNVSLAREVDSMLAAIMK